MGDSRTGVGNIQDEPGAWQKVRKCSKKLHSAEVYRLDMGAKERAPKGQSWNNVVLGITQNRKEIPMSI